MGYEDLCVEILQLAKLELKPSPDWKPL